MTDSRDALESLCERYWDFEAYESPFSAVLAGGAGVDLVPGRTYYLMFRSNNLGPLRKGYDFSSERTTVPPISIPAST